MIVPLSRICQLPWSQKKPILKDTWRQWIHLSMTHVCNPTACGLCLSVANMFQRARCHHPGYAAVLIRMVGRPYACVSNLPSLSRGAEVVDKCHPWSCSCSKWTKRGSSFLTKFRMHSWTKIRVLAWVYHLFDWYHVGTLLPMSTEHFSHPKACCLSVRIGLIFSHLHFFLHML
jgi:hypothetical protein